MTNASTINREQIEQAIEDGQKRENWERSWTRPMYGVAQRIRELVADNPGITLTEVNDALTERGWESLGPDHTPFVWGTIREIHRISNLAIVEGKRNGETHFHLYVASPDKPGSLPRDTSSGYRTLDEAILAGIVYYAEWKNHGLNAAANERLSGYLFRMLREEKS